MNCLLTQIEVTASSILKAMRLIYSPVLFHFFVHAKLRLSHHYDRPERLSH
jgi:hypothetical protein